MYASYGRADAARPWQDRAKSQLPLARLLKFGEEEWQLLGVPWERRAAARGVVSSPIFHAPLFWTHLGLFSGRPPLDSSLQQWVIELYALCAAWAPSSPQALDALFYASAGSSGRAPSGHPSPQGSTRRHRP